MVLYEPIINLNLPFSMENGIPKITEDEYRQYLSDLNKGNYTEKVRLLSAYNEYRVILSEEQNTYVPMTIEQFLKLTPESLKRAQNNFVHWTLPNLITEEQKQDIEEIDEKDYNRKTELAKQAEKLIGEFIGETETCQTKFCKRFQMKQQKKDRILNILKLKTLIERLLLRK